MDSSNWKICGSIFLLFLMLSKCTGDVLCYICHTSDVPECGDHFRIPRSNSKYVSSCFGSCLKRRGSRDSGSARRIEVQRSCTESRKEGCYVEDFNGIEQLTCVCNRNFCNGSSVITVSLILLLFYPLFIYFTSLKL